jgi:two-component system CheB/CheR fusion protein
MADATPTESPPARAALPLRVVGIGASAGGLAPLADFLQACPRGAGLACIVVQHLRAHQPSTLTEILRRRTRLTVVEAGDGQGVEADHVYVIQPGTSITLEGGRLRVSHQDEPAPHHPVDQLLRSMARDLGPAAVGVVLSGMGSDGGQGLRAIVAAGGQAFVQQPASAQFDGMPRHAAAAVGPAALVALPAKMPALMLQGAALASGAAAAPEDDAPDDLSAILRRLATVTGHDFSLYKTSSLRRRIDRRIGVHGLSSLGQYRRLLADSPQEADLLLRELFIGVTDFFRDPPVWEAVGATVLPALIERAARREQWRLRLWVVGCSTGEEAYTLAMLMHEALEAVGPQRQVTFQIFATDPSADAIEFARRGLYPASALAGVSPQRRERFFVPESGGLRVSKALRESVLFARHDVIGDAPFSRLDLVSCRNLLIYLKAALQDQVLRLFHYVLQRDGILILGNSETVGRAEALFQPIDPKLRIHRRIEAGGSTAGAAFPIRTERPETLPPEDPTVPDSSASTGPSLQTLADRLILDEFAPPAVLVDPAGDIVYVSGRTGRFLEPAAGKANWNVHAMAREGLRAALAAALRQVAQERRPAECRGLPIDVGGGPAEVDLLLRPVQLAGYGQLVLVVFRDVPPPRRRRRSAARDDELQRAHAEAEALREAMRSSQEELQSANEELQSTNEELQSTNEELTTSKEEMQAMNEELQTVNSELLSKIEDLAQAQSDLRNLLNSTQIATVFLDGHMNVRRFTEEAKKVINLRDGDVGRPLADITTSLEYPQLIDDAVNVLRTLVFCERSIRGADDHWYSVRIMPYRTQDNVIDGCVITFVDITALKELEGRLRQAAVDAGGAPGAARPARRKARAG